MEPNDILKILDELGQKLTPAGQYVFQLAVRQTIIDGVFNLVVAAVLSVFVIAVVRWIINTDKNSSDFDFGSIILGIPCIFVLPMIGISLYSGISKILNPEYAAITDILSKLIK